MRFGLYSVLDVNLGYGMPVVQENDAVAMRNFDNVCRDVNSVYHTHPSDFTLHCIGYFDSHTGVLEAAEHRRVCSALDFVGTLD